jgi:hypothetical protein
MRPFLLCLAVLGILGVPTFADGTLNFYNRAVFKPAQAYPLDKNVYSGWGPDWAGSGVFYELVLGFNKGPVGFSLDTQTNAGSTVTLQANFAQGWLTVIPDTLKVYAGKVRLDDYRWHTDFSDRGQGRMQTPDNWGAAAVTYSLKGTDLKTTLMVPAFIGTGATHLDAASTGANKPTSMTLTDSLQLADWAVSYADKGTGLRFVAGTIGDTSAGAAYGSTGSDLGAGFGKVDPKDSTRSWYGGLGWMPNPALDLWTASTWWADPRSAATSNLHGEVLTQVKWGSGDLKFGFDAVFDWDQGAATGDLKTKQIVNSLSTGTYTVPQTALTALGFLGATWKPRLPGLDLSTDFILGGGNRDRGNSIGTYTFPTYDRFTEGRATVTLHPTELAVGFDYKYDIDAQVSTWTVPVTYTFSSY